MAAVMMLMVCISPFMSPSFDDVEKDNINEDIQDGMSVGNGFITEVTKDTDTSVYDGTIDGLEDLVAVNTDGTSLGYRYLQTADIDLTDENMYTQDEANALGYVYRNGSWDTNGGFTLSLESSVSIDSMTISISGDAANIRIGMMHTVADDGTMEDVDVSSLSDPHEATVQYDASRSYTVMIGGTTGDTDTDKVTFAISFAVPSGYGGTDEPMEMNSNGNFDPIGDNSTDDADSCFSGSYNGNGYTIRGLDTAAYSKSESVDVYAGLFGYVRASTSGIMIKNIGLEAGSHVLISPSFVYAGGIAGYADSGRSSLSITIQNCYNTGDITSSSSSKVASAGGMVGYANAHQPSSPLTIQNCYSTGNVTASSSSSNVRAGGMIGYAYASHTIQNCHSSSSITASAFDYALAGGMVGYAYAEVLSPSIIRDCYNIGNVTAMAISYDAYAGGIAGEAYASAPQTIENCFNLGNVTASSSSGGAYGGGGIGYSDGTKGAAMYNIYFLEGSVNINDDPGKSLLYGGGSTKPKIYSEGALSDDDTAGNRSVSEMMDESTYYSGTTDEIAGWDFTHVWNISPNVNDGLPYIDLGTAYLMDLIYDANDVSVRTDPSIPSRSYPGDTYVIHASPTDDGNTIIASYTTEGKQHRDDAVTVDYDKTEKGYIISISSASPSDMWVWIDAVPIVFISVHLEEGERTALNGDDTVIYATDYVFTASADEGYVLNVEYSYDASAFTEVSSEDDEYTIPNVTGELWIRTTATPAPVPEQTVDDWVYQSILVIIIVTVLGLLIWARTRP